MTGYEALRTRCAYVDLSARGKLRATGEDRARLLHAMSTNDIEHLATNHTVYAFFLTAQGRIVADAYITNLGEALWIDTEPEAADRLFEHLDKYIIADDVTLENLTAEWAAVGVEGPESAAAVAKLDLARVSSEAFRIEGTVTGSGVRYFLPAASKTTLLQALSLPEATLAEARIVRMENRIPRYGEEISERYLVQETQQLHAVHFNKGCYLGQEIVERVRSRGLVHRFLTPIEITGTEAPTPGTKLTADGKEAGEVTSAVWSPALDKVIGFAYLRNEALQSKATIQVEVGSVTQQASVRL